MALFVPVVATVGTLGLVLLSRGTAKAATPPPGPGPGPAPAPGPGPRRRQLRKDRLPPGTEIARVTPACDAQDTADCKLGLMLNHTPQPSGGKVSATGAIGGKGSPVNPHTGEEVGVLEKGIAAADGSGGEWWRVLGAGGVEGFVRFQDPRGRQNLVLTGEITPGGGEMNVSGWGPGWGRPWSPWHRRYARHPYPYGYRRRYPYARRWW